MLDSISIIVPVYNSTKTLKVLHDRLITSVTPLCNRYEIILIDDGSEDASWDCIEEIISNNSAVRGLRLMRNFGQHNALLCGIRKAKSEVIVTIDDDLQNPPEEICKLLAKLEEGYDVVYGTPIKRKQNLWRSISASLTRIALKSAMGVETASSVSAFRAFRTCIREAFSEYNGPFVSIDVLLSWGSTAFSSVPVKHEPRKAGCSNYTFYSLISHALDMMTGFSTRPLRVSSIMGFLFTIFGVGVLLYVIIRYLALGYSVPGFPFLASIISIFAGAQLFALGIIGEYLARVHFRTMDRPAYVVRYEYDKEPKDSMGLDSTDTTSHLNDISTLKGTSP
ncbi:MAG: glycosyltransferase [Candidatus Aegiribacteria sp.]|nr:glycosyltransferase [Candidatus Aegiribacteria sp.]